MTKNGMRAIHPGEILREEYLAPLGMSANALAKGLNVKAAQVSGIVHGHRRVTANIASRLAAFFGGDAQSWLNLQSAYDMKVGDAFPQPGSQGHLLKLLLRFLRSP